MVTPYYSDDHVTLYHGDCLDLLDQIEADVLVTDPPYGIDYESNHADESSPLARRIVGDEDTAVRDAVLRWWGNRPAIVFGSPKLPPLGPPLIWHKPGAGMGDLKYPWRLDYEHVYVLGDGWSGHRGTSVIRANIGMSKRDTTGHPHQKPAGLMAALIEKAPPGVVFDPFAGSGSTLRAAKNLGRRAIGIEIEERYCEVIIKRLAQEVLL